MRASETMLRSMIAIVRGPGWITRRTAEALLARGLVFIAREGSIRTVPLYGLTDAGRRALAEHEAKTAKGEK